MATELEVDVAPHAHLQLSNSVVVVLLGVLCVIAYAPALNNGFIADDFVIMQRTQILETNPWYLLSVVPRWPLPAAVLFAVFQAPQEAVMWLAAMNEGLQGLFILSTILLWDRHRYTLSVICFSFALVSKESAVILLLMIALWQAMCGRPLFPKAYFGFLIPASVFSFVFLYTVSHNFMLTSGNYVIGFQAPLVIVKTLFRLTWPWLYILLASLLRRCSYSIAEDTGVCRIDFPYPQIEIAKAAVLAAPGWNPESVSAATVGEKCVRNALYSVGMNRRSCMSTNFTSRKAV